jgi:hypothetical protein
MDLVQRTNKQFACEHTPGEISSVRLCPAGLALRRIRFANLPPEISKETIMNAPDKCELFMSV